MAFLADTLLRVKPSPTIGVTNLALGAVVEIDLVVRL